MILGTAEVTPTQINVKLYDKYAKLNNIKQQSDVGHKKDYIEANNTKVVTNGYEQILNELIVPKNPDEAISKLNQLRQATHTKPENISENKGIVMGMNLMKVKLQLQEIEKL